MTFQAALLNMAGANQALDDMDMVSGIRLGGGRYPVAEMASAMRGAVTQNNITISNSSVGVVNTGDLAKINAVITLTEGSDAAELGTAIRQLTQAVLDSGEIAADTKRELVSLVSSLSEQVTTKRSKSVMGSILKGIEERVRPINAIWTLFSHVAALVGTIMHMNP
jgi:hypothetical protein